MSVARTWAIALTGLDASVVEVEADLSSQTPDFRLIGLPDKSLGEAVQRIHNACANSNLVLPRRRVTVNLSPASLPKQGSSFDVAIALSALACEHTFADNSLERTVHIGELGLDGRVRPVSGVLPAVLGARAAGFTHVVVPIQNADEARLVTGIDVFGAVTLAHIVRHHGLEIDLADVVASSPTPIQRADDSAVEKLDLSDVVGQEDAVNAMVIAAAGGHHVMLNGPPGAGKTMLAQRLPSILPPLDDDAALRVASVRSLCGTGVTRLDRVPPFEAPHHSATLVSLVGGGSRVVRPGALARAGEGVLFLDEAGEFSAHVLDALRQPLEGGRVTIHRANFVAEFPARFQLVLATNPCPCGNYGVRGARCECPPQAIRRYAARLSAPLRDRLDVVLQVRRVTSVPRVVEGNRVTSVEARELVLSARARAEKRLRDSPWSRNSEVAGVWLREGPYAPPAEVRRDLDAALSRGSLTLRSYDRVLRVAWTIADIAGADAVEKTHVGRALFLKQGVSV